jgi:hypothetical protein
LLGAKGTISWNQCPNSIDIGSSSAYATLNLASSSGKSCCQGACGALSLALERLNKVGNGARLDCEVWQMDISKIIKVKLRLRTY